MADATTILIVDDHQLFRDVLTAYLEQESDLRIVGFAGTSMDAYASAVEHKPDIILMDHVLPDAPGTDAIADIKDALPETKVIMVTGTEDDVVLIDAVKAGCSGFVSKGSAPPELIATIRLIAGGATVLPDRVGPLLVPTTETGGRLFDLTPREIEILTMLARGETTRAIGETLYISVNTVRNHTQRIIKKLEVHSKLEAVTTAVREGIVDIA